MEIFSLLTIIFIGVLLLHTTTEVNGQGDMICVYCQKYFKQKCFTSRKYVAYDPADIFFIKTRVYGETDKNPNLAKCLPDTYRLDGELIKMACAMSPEHGCTVMTLPKTQKDYEEYCVQCGQSCGCINWKKKDVQSKSAASRLMMNGCMLAACLTLVVNAFLNKAP